MFDDLGESFLKNAIRKRGEGFRVGKDKARLMKGADEVFAKGTVHPCLATDGAINLSHDGGRHLNHRNATEMDGGNKSGEITDNSPPKGKENALSVESISNQAIAEFRSLSH